MRDLKTGPELVSVYLQHPQKHEPKNYLGICSVDLSPERVVQIMRANFAGKLVAKLVTKEGFETHWLLSVE